MAKIKWIIFLNSILLPFISHSQIRDILELTERVVFADSKLITGNTAPLRTASYEDEIITVYRSYGKLNGLIYNSQSQESTYVSLDVPFQTETNSISVGFDKNYLIISTWGSN